MDCHSHLKQNIVFVVFKDKEGQAEIAGETTYGRKGLGLIKVSKMVRSINTLLMSGLEWKYRHVLSMLLLLSYYIGE
jgi:hypothetical protein